MATIRVEGENIFVSDKYVVDWESFDILVDGLPVVAANDIDELHIMTADQCEFSHGYDRMYHDTERLRTIIMDKLYGGE